MGIRDFIGKVCPYCKWKITAGEQIVMCSDCEMPHHRDCWIENQGCTTFGCQGTIQSAAGAFSGRMSGEIVFDGMPSGRASVRYCSQCGFPNTAAGTFCSECGSRLVAPRMPGR